jgi:hypothetical protein
MSKLIQKYMVNPTQANLDKMRAHFKKHPFSFMMITKDEMDFLSSLDLDDANNPWKGFR